MANDLPPFLGPPARFCPMCGEGLTEREIDGDHKPRLVCDGCGHIHYVNPKVVGATIPVLDGKVLLARRAIEPRTGAWTYPAGFLEMGETVEEGAMRETYEEILVRVELRGLLNVYSRVPAGIVTVVYKAQVVEGTGEPGAESLVVQPFAPEEIPWDGLAFDSTTKGLRDWVRLVSDGRA